MHYVSTRSPFVNPKEEAEWLTWQAQTPLFSLICDKETDSRFVNVNNGCDITECADALYQSTAIPSLQRNQYNAVLNRFDLASKRAGSFSTWNT